MRVLLVLFYLVISTAYTQQYQDDDFEYKREVTYGLNLNTIAPLLGGITLKFSHLLKSKKNVYHTWLLEGTIVKHTNEVKVSRPGSSSSYVKGKENHFFPIRLMYGRERTLFFEAKDEGVQLNLITAIGPCLGIQKPYYILFGKNQDNAQYVKNNYSRDDSQIQGQGGLFMGLDESTYIPGLSSRISLNLGIDSFRSNVTGVELGLQVDLFPKEIRIIPVAGDRSTFISGFIVGYFGNRW